MQGCACPYLRVFRGDFTTVVPALLEENPLGKDARQRLRTPQYGDERNEVEKDRDKKQEARGSYSRFLGTHRMYGWLRGVWHTVEFSFGSQSRWVLYLPVC